MTAASVSSTAEPPEAVRDLAEGCVRFVERSLGLKLDYAPETLSLLDHYVAEGRAAGRDRPETIGVLAQAAGAYFGEVVRRKYASWWRIEGDAPMYWQLELEPVFLSFCPVALMYDALTLGAPGRGEEGEQGVAGLELEEEDRQVVANRLADLPPVPEEEFFAPSTRLEVIDIAVEALRAKRMAAGEPEPHFGPHDYQRDPAG